MEPPGPLTTSGALTCGNATHTLWRENFPLIRFSIWDRPGGLSTSRQMAALDTVIHRSSTGTNGLVMS